MPSKYRIILEMASQTARDIASNADRYTDFLITAANNYKYSFKEQLLIHAQKPDATACAEIDTWNKLGRWVNKGTKGIALLIDRDVPYKLRHVFDISDTNSRAGRNITLWQMKPEYEYAVSESLQASFGDVEEPRDFPHLLIDISGYAVEDNLSDYLMELNAVKAGSFLEELDDTSLEAWLKTSLKSSVAFMALSRAGYEPRQYFDREDFSHLFDFNTVEVISVLGAAVSDISEMVIREMGETVKEMEKEEKRKIRTFAQTGPSAYHKNRTENKERSNEHGTDLYDAGGLSDSRSDRAGEPEAWKVWNAAADIPPQTPGWDLHRDAAERNTEQSFGGGGPAGAEDAGRPDRADEGAERSDGAAEGRGSDAVGADDELHSSLGGGSDSERPDLRVTLPTVEQQQEIVAEAEEEKGINKESIWTTQKLLSTPQVWIHGLTLGVQLLFASGLMVQLFPRLLEIGFDPGMAGMMMLASGLLALPGSYLCGVIDSKIGARKAAYTSYVFGILAMLLNLTGNTVCVWISLVCIGMVVGGAANWPASLCIEEFGDSFANGYGIIQPMIQVVGAVGPAFFAAFYGMTGSYKIPYICGAVLMFIGLIGFATLAKPGFAKKEEEKYKK